MVTDLTWQQRQCKALGLPFEGAQPPALLIALHDAGNPNFGLGAYALYAPLPLGTSYASDIIVNDYIRRIATIIRRNNMFDALDRPVMKITCVPPLSATGNFPLEEKILAREIDWLTYDRKYEAAVTAGPHFIAHITLPKIE